VPGQPTVQDSIIWQVTVRLSTERCQPSQRSAFNIQHGHRPHPTHCRSRATRRSRETQGLRNEKPREKQPKNILVLAKILTFCGQSVIRGNGSSQMARGGGYRDCVEVGVPLWLVVWRRSCGDVRHGHGASYEAAGLDQVITVSFTLCSSLALLVSWRGKPVAGVNMWAVSLGTQCLVRTKRARG